jgi:hypothetical protein
MLATAFAAFCKRIQRPPAPRQASEQSKEPALRGGTRTGAGRPKGALGKKIKKTIEKSEAAGIMPRDVLLNVHVAGFARDCLLQRRVCEPSFARR